MSNKVRMFSGSTKVGEDHPRFVCHFLPVHCSWMNQVEQWLSILQRKRLRISDFASLDHLAERLMAYVSEWNAAAASIQLVYQV